MTASSPGIPQNDNDTPQKGNVTKRKFPDFSRAFSQDNALLSGNESDGWDFELDYIQEKIAAANDAEREDASNMEDPVAEVQEFEHILENVAMEEEEGNADEVVVYDSVKVTKKTHTVADLKVICNALNVSTSGNKAALFLRIRECESPLVVQIDAESFVFKQIRGEEADPSLPCWVILNSEPAPDIPGIDMLRGAEMGFYGPTNVENVAGAPKHQYCCSEEEKVRRPEFSSKNPDHPTSEKGHISDAARKLLPNEIRDCRPKHFFDTQISPKFVQRCIVDTTNARAAAEGAGFGGTVYTDYEPFDLEEVNKMIGLLFLNGVAPRPMFTMWFEHHNIFGNEFIAKAMNKQMARGDQAIRGIRRWKHFRRFMCMFDFREDAKKETKKNPLWKVQRLLDELNENASTMWIPGKWLSIDEQTLGFQGRSELKLRISYKKEGDGFQCDAVCDDGYTFSFFFRHGDAPPLPKEFKEKISDLSPTAMHVVWLALRLPNMWSRIYMDNLFNS
jgi:hypothetical protein